MAVPASCQVREKQLLLHLEPLGVLAHEMAFYFLLSRQDVFLSTGENRKGLWRTAQLMLTDRAHDTVSDRCRLAQIIRIRTRAKIPNER